MQLHPEGLCLHKCLVSGVPSGLVLLAPPPISYTRPLLSRELTEHLSAELFSYRHVGGSAGRYGAGNAWVTFRDGGRTFLLEPLLAAAGETMPRLKTLRYQRAVSVEWDGQKLRYFEHEGRAYDPPLLTVLALLPEWVAFWCYT